MSCRFVQAQNPRTRRFVKIDRKLGTIVSHKETKGPYANISVIGKQYDKE